MTVTAAFSSKAFRIEAQGVAWGILVRAPNVRAVVEMRCGTTGAVEPL